MEIPRWLRTVASDESRAESEQGNPLPSARSVVFRKGRERFLDKTLRHVISFVEDTMFNEVISAQSGLLQMVEPKVKVISLLSFVVVLSLQKSIEGIAIFSLLAILLVFASKIPFTTFIKRLLPAAALTLVIAIPAVLNVIVEGDSLLGLFRFESSVNIGSLGIPQEIAVTRQGLLSAVTLILRVITSVSIVFLLTMTTPPNTFMKTLSSLVPGPLQPVVAISYRYIFFLVRKVEHFVMGLRSRQIAAVTSTTGRHWTASRIGLLFSMSMELSNDLTMAMESRGCRGERFNVRGSTFGVRKLSLPDKAWLIFSVLFAGAMIWKSSA
jgi:cobalt/nickel transport system permease protein